MLTSANKSRHGRKSQKLLQEKRYQGLLLRFLLVGARGVTAYTILRISHTTRSPAIALNLSHLTTRASVKHKQMWLCK